MNPSTGQRITTPHGTIQFPAYVPVTTFGERYPLDALIQPYLPRLCQAVMVSLHYAKQMKARPRLPMFIDSGGFAALFQGSRITEQDGLGCLEVTKEATVEHLTPAEVLGFQEQHADVAFTLDFPIPPGTGRKEAERRLELTVANAIWALENRRRRDLVLYACVQAWDRESAAACARTLAHYNFDGFAIGGLVPRARDWTVVEEMVSAVQREIGSRPLHVFGLGKPETTAKLFAMGVSSVDSSSYIKLAADGRLWSRPDFQLQKPSTPELLRLAIENLATASRSTLPLSVSHPREPLT